MGQGRAGREARSPPRSAFPPHRETEGPHLGLTHEHRHGEEMLAHTTMHAPSAPHHTGTRAKPHLPGCGRTRRGSLPSARGPARSHACRSPASGPPAAHWERIGGPWVRCPPPLSHHPQTPSPGPCPSPPGLRDSGMSGSPKSQPRVHAHRCVSVYVCFYVWMCFWLHECVFLCIRFHVSVWVYFHIQGVCLCMCFHVSVWMCFRVCVFMLPM